MPDIHLEIIEHLDGLYVGLLSAEELEAFEISIKKGLAERDYDHIGGFLGMPKVRIKRT